MKKLTFKIICASLLLLSTGCTKKQEVTQTTDIDKFLESYEPSAVPESDYMTGDLSSDFKTYTVTVNPPDYRFYENEATITFKLDVKEDDSIFCGRYFENIEMESFENTKGWDEVKFDGIDSIQLENDNTKAFVNWTYTGVKDGEEVTIDECSLILLYKECEYKPN